MLQIGTLEAKNRLSSLLDEVLDGEEIVITRHGKPVARLVPMEAGSPDAKARRVIAETRRLRDSIKPRGAPLSWDELKNAGRKW